jgi:serine/threonine protein kinase
MYTDLFQSQASGAERPSRYRTDFEELEHVGRGGFGAVVKVRNKLDQRIYAIKTIKLDPSKPAYSRKVIREVTNLSKLNHPHVVRYGIIGIDRNECIMYQCHDKYNHVLNCCLQVLPGMD